LLIKIRGANHFLFSDDGALLESHVEHGTLLGVLPPDAGADDAVAEPVDRSGGLPARRFSIPLRGAGLPPPGRQRLGRRSRPAPDPAMYLRFRSGILRLGAPSHEPRANGEAGR
jgi:hypothetical protein